MLLLLGFRFFPGAFFHGINGFFHGKGYPVSTHIDVEYGYGDLLLNLDDVGWVFHESIRHLTDMNEAVLMDTDIYECAKGRYVRHDTWKLHAFTQIRDFFDTVGK